MLISATFQGSFLAAPEVKTSEPRLSREYSTQQDERERSERSFTRDTGSAASLAELLLATPMCVWRVGV